MGKNKQQDASVTFRAMTDKTIFVEFNNVTINRVTMRGTGHFKDYGSGTFELYKDNYGYSGRAVNAYRQEGFMDDNISFKTRLALGGYLEGLVNDWAKENEAELEKVDRQEVEDQLGLLLREAVDLQQKLKQLEAHTKRLQATRGRPIEFVRQELSKFREERYRR